MKRALAALLAGFFLAAPAAADRAGAFDYYLLALSWNASWCEAEGDARASPQCDPARDHGFILHGLWPQHLDGWPEYCRTEARDPTRRETAAMADIMGSAGLAWYQWKKHGRCSGLDPAAYFDLARRAWEGITRPELLRRVERELEIAPEVLEAAFLEANPGLDPGAVGVTCRDGLFREIRICLDRDLAPRPCTGPVARECQARSVAFPPMR